MDFPRGEHGVKPVPSLADAAACHPQGQQRGRQRQGQVGVGIFTAPHKCGAQVVDLGLGIIEALCIVGVARVVEKRGQSRVVVAVARPHGVDLAGLVELFQGILPHGLQQPVTGSTRGFVGQHQRLLDEQREPVENLIARHITAANHRSRVVEEKTAYEHRQPAEQDPLGFGQECVRPIHRTPQRLLALRQGTRGTAGQQLEAVTQTIHDLGQRQGPHPRRRQLDCQRHTV